MIVDCLLPGAIRRLGSKTTFVAPRTPARLSARECEIRGGEYVQYDRADLNTALDVWLDSAAAGNASAQYNVGVMFERGMGVPPDFSEAAHWYELAAQSGHRAAIVNLAHLYERGLGVAADPRRALQLYQSAGVDNRSLDLPPGDSVRQSNDAAEVQAAITKLRSENEALAEALATTRAALDLARSDASVARSDVDRLETRLRELAAEAGRVEQLHFHQIGALERKLETLEGTNVERARMRDQAAEDAKRAQDRADQARAALSTAQSDATLLSAQLAQAEVKLRERARLAQEREKKIEALGLELELLRLQREEARKEAHARAQAIASGLLAGPNVTIVAPNVGPDRKVTLRDSNQASQKIVGRIEASAPMLSLLVNGAAVATNVAGVFQHEIAVDTLPAPVEVIAVDQQGKRALAEFEFVSEHPAKVRPRNPLSDIDFGTYHALVIGNDEYRHLPKLSTAVHDANAIARILEKRFGYSTEVLLNATRYELLSALNRYRETLNSNDNLLIFYAGHGELDRVNMRGHWLPVDAERSSTANWVSNVAITDILNVMAAKQVLLIVDSCYSGALTRSAVSTLPTGMSDAERMTWVKSMTEKRARLVLASGGLAPVLDEGGQGHSVFARSLIDVLQGAPELLEGRSLHREVAARVAHAAGEMRFEQVPEYAPIRFAGHETGEYFFVPRSPEM